MTDIPSQTPASKDRARGPIGTSEPFEQHQLCCEVAEQAIPWDEREALADAEEPMTVPAGLDGLVKGLSLR